MPSVAVAHAMPGRVRLRIAPLKGDAAAAAALTARLREVPGVRAAEASALTGSVVLEYAATLLDDPPALSALASAVTDTVPEVDVEELAALVERDLPEPSVSPPAEPIVSDIRLPHVDWRLAVPAGLAMLGVAAFVGARRRPAPSWHTLLWYAFGTYSAFTGMKGRS